jgi:hypothetical protein
MITPDYFAFRWSWYRPILNRHERPIDRCRVDVRRLPIRMAGQDAGDYVPFAVHPAIEQTISTALRRLQDLAIRYMVRGEKVSAHQLPPMDVKSRAMVAYLRKQNPHLSRDLLHHWCADPRGATALLEVWEVLWEQGWKQDQADAAPWVPAINVLLLRLMRNGVGALPDEEEETTDHVMLCVIGGLYIWALKSFLKRYLEGVVEVNRIATYESMMMPVTPMTFLHHQPDVSLLADDSQLMRAYGLEPEIVPQLRLLRVKMGSKNEGGLLGVLAKTQLGAHLLRRTWARLSLWQLAMKTGHGDWMQWVLDAKRLDQLLALQVRPDEDSMENLKANTDEPVAKWLLAQMEGGRAARNAGEPWLRDHMTLVAFQVFDEDIKVEVARRKAERLWLDRKPELLNKGRAVRGLRTGGLRAGGMRASETDKVFEKAWQDGELVLIQPEVTKGLHSGKALSLRHGCLRLEWSDYLAELHAGAGADSAEFLSRTFLPGVMGVIEEYEGLFLDECSASGCLLRGPVLGLVKVGIALRGQLRKWHGGFSDQEKAELLPLSMCLDLTGEWTFTQQKHAKLGEHRIAFSTAVALVEAGVSRDSGMERLIHSRNVKVGLKPVGGVSVEPVATGAGQTVQAYYNKGFALTQAAVSELKTLMANKASMKEYHVHAGKLKGVLDGYRLPGNSLELLVIHRLRVGDEPPWLLMKAGRPCLAGADVDIYELLDADCLPAQSIAGQGLPQWGR